MFCRGLNSQSQAPSLNLSPQAWLPNPPLVEASIKKRRRQSRQRSASQLIIGISRASSPSCFRRSRATSWLKQASRMKGWGTSWEWSRPSSPFKKTSKRAYRTAEFSLKCQKRLEKPYRLSCCNFRSNTFRKEKLTQRLSERAKKRAYSLRSRWLRWKRAIGSSS